MYQEKKKKTWKPLDQRKQEEEEKLTAAATAAAETWWERDVIHIFRSDISFAKCELSSAILWFSVVSNEQTQRLHDVILRHIVEYHTGVYGTRPIWM